jgi:large subunit ribosomal protein L7/L12
MAPAPAAWPAAAPPASGLPADLDAQVRAMLGAGRKIEAIKLVRDTTRMGLAEAKNLVERM